MKIFKIYTTILLTTILLSFFLAQSYAMEVVSRDNLQMDDALSEEQSFYTQPQKIYITQVRSTDSELKNNTKSWIRSIYYYSITRLKLNDIPFNYLVDSSGNVYEGTKGGPGVNPGLEAGDNVVLIGILDSSSTITPRTQTSIVELVETLSYKYGIKEGSWDFVDLKIAKSENERSYLKATPLKSSIFETMAQIMGTVRWNTQEHLEYKASIVNVEYPKELVIGKMLNVKVTIKNENDFTWFGDTNYIYVTTDDSSESPYAINSVWESFSKPTHIQDKFVKPGGEVEIQFNMAGKSRPGEYSEKFALTKDTSSVFEGSEFEVTFNLVAGDNKLVEVVSPEYGFVNIRECRWYSCEKIEVANEGDVFIMSKEEEGWYEILFNEGTKGWVYQKYIREL